MGVYELADTLLVSDNVGEICSELRDIFYGVVVFTTTSKGDVDVITFGGDVVDSRRSEVEHNKIQLVGWIVDEFKVILGL